MWAIVRRGRVFSLILLLTTIALSLHPLDASAQSYDWSKDDITIEKNSKLSTNPDEYGPIGGCEYQNVTLPDERGRYREISQCIFQAKSFRYTVYDGRLYLNFGNSNSMYPLINWGFRTYSYLTQSPNTDDIIYGSSYFKDVPSHITSNNDPNNPGYIDLPNFRHLLSVDEQGKDHNTANNVAVSNNGRWIVLNFGDIGYVRFDSLNMSAKWIAPHVSSNEFLAISNDGNTLVTVTWGYDPIAIYSIKGCGEESNTLKNSWFSEYNQSPCISKNLSTLINTFLGSGTYTSPAVPSFNNDGNELTVFVRSDNKDGAGIVLKIPNKKIPPRLDYLALGDSYSSGEGDTGKAAKSTNFYLPATDYSGGCHVSTRSYPFLLKSTLKIEDSRMKSIACSGARVRYDYFGDSLSYQGQGNRLTNEASAMQQSMKNDALRDFTPGMIKQLDYVKANKPAIVTFTGGGNDVGFASILTYCAMPSGVGEYSNTCEMALSGTKQRSVLGDSIRSQYDQILQFIAAIKAASINTKVYVVGYPSFVADDKNTCLNAGMLNGRERTMINQGVSYLNEVLHQAAKAAGAYFVDTETTLHGGRICEGSQYMTGLLSVLGFDINERKSEMFHPNALGHEQLAKSIIASGISAEGDNPSQDGTIQAPAKPAYFGDSTYEPTIQDKLIRDTAIYAGKKLQMSISPGLFAANQALNFTIWSDETALGAQSTDMQGGLDGELTLPSFVKPGYHMLLAEGTSPTGEPMRVYQFIEIRKSVNDADGDGIVDGQDPCEFIASWYDEQTGRDICETSVQTGNGSSGAMVDHPATTDSGESNSTVAVNKGFSDIPTGTVLGAHDMFGKTIIPSKNADSEKNVPLQLAAGVGSLLMLLGILYAAKIARRRFEIS